MESIIFTKEPSVFNAACERFALAPAERPAETLGAASNGLLTAYLCEDVAKCVAQSVSERSPARIHFAGFASAVSTECRPGDVVLPNAFYRMETGVFESERTKEALSKFGKDAIFLETYELQGDYDFGDFGLSVGGACVSGPEVVWHEGTSALFAAYAADVSDRDSFAAVSSVPDDADTAACVELAIADPDSPDPSVDAERLVSIIAFLEESFSGDGGEEDEEDDGDSFDDEER